MTADRQRILETPASAVQVIPFEMGMLGMSLEAIASGEKGHVKLPIGPRDLSIAGGRRWVRVKVTAIEDIRAFRDIVVGNEQGGVKEIPAASQEVQFESADGVNHKVSEDHAFPMTSNRAAIYKKYNLAEDEAMKTFIIVASAIPSAYPWCVTSIAASGTANLIDAETGIAMPYTVSSGYELETLMLWSSFDQTVKAQEYLDGYLFAEFYHLANTIYYENEVSEFSTTTLDPECTSEHVVEFKGTNTNAGASMNGTAQIICILRAHGTERSTVKTIRCKYCGNEETVSRTTTTHNCSKCGKLNLYYVMPSRL